MENILKYFKGKELTNVKLKIFTLWSHVTETPTLTDLILAILILCFENINYCQKNLNLKIKKAHVCILFGK